MPGPPLLLADRVVDDEEVGAPSPCEQLREGQAGIAGEEVHVRDLVAPCSLDGVRDGLLDQLDAPHLTRLRGEREGDRADPRVEVIDPLPTLQGGVFGDDPVEQLGHLGVRLEEGLGGDAQIERAETLGQLRIPPDELRLPAGRGLGDAARARPEHPREGLPEPARERCSEGTRLELALGGDDPDLQPTRVTTFAHDEVAQAGTSIRAWARALVGRPAATPASPLALAAASLPCLQAFTAAPLERDLARQVAALGCEQAILHLDHAVTARRRMEAADEVGVGGVALVAEGVLELVAIAPLLARRDDLLEDEPVEVPDPPQCLIDLTLLDLQLALVGDDLPGDSRVICPRGDPLWARLEDLEGARMGIAALALVDYGAHAVAGNGSGDEDHIATVTETRHALASEGERVDLQLELVSSLWTGGPVRGRVHAGATSASNRAFCAWRRFSA